MNGKISNFEAFKEFINSLGILSDGTIENAPQIISVSVEKAG